jgi:SMI1 / KNR4 family (SUKH-1)
MPELVPSGAALRPWIVDKIAEHGLSLGPPLSERDVQAFEVMHGVELPEAYRWFVTTVGNGGNGPPHYGLAPLNDAQDEEGEPNPDIARPQPLTEPRQDFLEWYASWLAER